jgi:hypothetical protein
MSDEANKPQENDQPQVFAVSKDLGGKWKFNRRDFVKAAGAATAAGGSLFEENADYTRRTRSAVYGRRARSFRFRLVSGDQPGRVVACIGKR